MNVFEVINIGILNFASDIHIVVGENVFFRVNGQLERTKYRVREVDINRFVDRILDQADREGFNLSKNIDKSIDYGSNRLRIHLFKEKNGLSLAIRTIPKEIPRLEDLNLAPSLAKVRDIKSGLVLVAGSTGMGKTTTLASLVESINLGQERNIVTIEDPIEYIYKSKKSLIRQREVGEDVISFQEGIKSVVRQDPDIIVIGELRDMDSIKAGISLAEIGHLVMATIHSRSGIETISRLIDIFPREEKEEVRLQLSNSLRAIIYQELIVSQDKRYPICEIIMVNDAIRNIIRENKNLRLILDQMRLNSKDLGSVTLEESIRMLLDRGRIVRSDISNILDRKDFNKLNL